MAFLLSAASDDGSLVAVAAPSSGGSTDRCLIQVYETPASNNGTDASLQLTLTHTTTGTTKLRQLVIVGRTLVLGLFGRRQVVVWDLERGVVSCTHTLDGNDSNDGSNDDDDKSYVAISKSSSNLHDGQPNRIQSSSSSDHYYILMRIGRKLLVHEYQGSNHKLVRKIKSGKMDSHVDHLRQDEDGVPAEASLAVTLTHILVRTQDHGVRIMDKESGDKVGKIKTLSKNNNQSSSFFMTSSQEMSVCVNNMDVVGLILDTGAVGIYDVNTSTQLAEIPPSSQATSSSSGNLSGSRIQLIQEIPDGKAQVERSDKASFVVLCDHVLSRVSTTAKKSQHEQLTTLSCDDPVTVVLQERSSIDQPEDRMMALIYKKGSAECHPQSILIDQNFPVVLQLGQDDMELEVKVGAPNKRKLQTPATDVLGPGQAGSDTIPVVKKRKVRSGSMDDDLDEVDERKEKDEEGTNLTIAERLQQLKEALDEEDDDEEDDDDRDDEEVDDEENDTLADSKTNVAFKPKMATTESLKELLTQALQSSDDAMLELALAVRDTKIVSKTLRDLDDTLLVNLLGKLTTRLAASPLRAETLAVWISYCLKLGTFEPQNLSTLKNMLYERIESFPDLLRLEGRLSMMIEADD